MKTATLTTALFLALGLALGARADLVVECVGCEPPSDNQSVNLLLRADEATPITLRWKSNEDPAPGEAVAVLYAGNPVIQDSLTRRGPLEFVAEDGGFTASHPFTAEDLGRGTFLAVVVREAGRREEILDWRPFRLLTVEEERREQEWLEPAGQWSIDVRPWLLQVESGHGSLPRFRGGDEPVWWPFGSLRDDATDVDIDGEHTGVPGISVQVSTWETTAGAGSWKDRIKDKLTGVKGRTIRFGELKWLQQEDRPVELGGEIGTVWLKHFYSLVTLHTSASFQTFDRPGIFGSTTAFSHETSARLKHPKKDPRFWASYSRREVSADAHLLELLAAQTTRSQSVPGLGGVQQDDGDGGTAVYRLGFVVRVRPWEVEEAPPEGLRAGIVALDVVAARAGYGAVFTQGSTGRSEVEDALCKVLRCGDSAHGLDLDDPPDGYRVFQPSSSLLSREGDLAMLRGQPLLARRDRPNFPSVARFAIGAHLRAGALLRQGRKVRNLTPIDAYAQYVLKITVAAMPGTPLVGDDELIAPDPKEIGVVTPVPESEGFFAWIRKHLGLSIALAVLLGIVALAVLVPGFRQVLSAFFEVLGAWLRKLKPKGE